MNKELKNKWLEALRSGEYKQGVNFLRNIGDNYCCLGVLYEVEGISPLDIENSGKSICYRYDGINTSFPSNEVIKRWGMSIGTCNNLAKMNDNGKRFNEIADWIEENL